VLSQGEPRDAAVNFDTYSIFPWECVSAVQGHPRSLFLVGTNRKRAYATSY